MAEEKEVTIRNTLLECLESERLKWKRASKKQDTLEPARGWEAEWIKQRRKCEILQGLIQALESEQVKRAIARWVIEKEVASMKQHAGEVPTKFGGRLIRQPAEAIEDLAKTGK